MSVHATERVFANSMEAKITAANSDASHEIFTKAATLYRNEEAENDYRHSTKLSKPAQNRGTPNHAPIARVSPLNIAQERYYTPVVPIMGRSTSESSESQSGSSLSGEDESDFLLTPRDDPTSPTLGSAALQGGISTDDFHYEIDSYYRGMTQGLNTAYQPTEVTTETWQRIHQLASQASVDPSPEKNVSISFPRSLREQLLEICSVMTESRQPRRKALCIGIDYKGLSGDTLKGCVNDAHRMRDFLIKHGYKAEDVRVLSEEGGKESLPTRDNIINAVTELVAGARKDDRFFFHYSGHGIQIDDKNGDEVDKLDEVLVPLDYKTSGYILDDELHEIMAKNLPEGCHLTALIDACHSGTMLDLPYNYHCNLCTMISIVSSECKNTQSSERLITEKALHKYHCSGPTDELEICSSKPANVVASVVSWSGCMDSQKSKEVCENGRYSGFMTNTFLSCLESKSCQTIQELYHDIVGRMSCEKLQKPQLGVSRKMNVAELFVF